MKFFLGTFSHMDPNVVAVPPTGYGPAVCYHKNTDTLKMSFEFIGLG